MVRHDILLAKLEAAAVKVTVLKLVKPLLKERKHRVRIQNNLSNDKPVNLRVPQGSVLAPDLFVVVISDNLSRPFLGEIIALADDVASLYVFDDWEQIKYSMLYDLLLLRKWCEIIQLTLTFKKEKFKFLI